MKFQRDDRLLALLEGRNDPGDWPEDFSHENGEYENRCTTCDKLFFGHKRRVQCKRHLLERDAPIAS